MNNILYRLLLISYLTFGSVQAHPLLNMLNYSKHLIKLDEDSDKALENCNCSSTQGEKCEKCKSIFEQKKQLDKLMIKIAIAFIVIGAGTIIYTAIKIKQNPNQFQPTNLIKIFLVPQLHSKLLQYFHR